MADQLFRETLIEQITNKLREEILLQNIPAGSHITIQSIAKRFNTSLTPVREAFQTLHSEQLLTIVPYKGAIVSAVDQKYLNNLYDIMRNLEVLVVENAFDVWTEKMCAEVTKINQEYSDYIDFLEKQGGDAWASPRVREQCILYNTAFHDPLFACCENVLAFNLFKHYRDMYHIARRRTEAIPLERRKASITEHQQIIDALNERNYANFREAYNQHSINAKMAFFSEMK